MALFRMTNFRYTRSLCVLFLFGSILWAPAATIYVRAIATGLNNGSSWANAYTSLQTALAVAGSGDAVWVASGSYKPTSGTDRTAAFRPSDGVTIYGGFYGNETSISQRDWTVNETVISGDLLGNDTSTLSRTEPTRSDNSYHVFIISNKTTGITLDGITVSGGYENESNIVGGGGIICGSSTLTIRNSKFQSNYGARASSIRDDGQSTVNIERCVFRDNIQCCAGAVHIGASTFSISRSLFWNNRTQDSPFGYQWAGAMFLAGGGSGTVVNCAFIQNYAEHEGGAIFNQANTKVINCTFWGNQAVYNGQTLHNE